MKSIISIIVFLLGAIFSGARSPATVNVGVILDLQTPIGRAYLAAISLAHSDFYATHPDSPARINLLSRRSSLSDPVDAASKVLDLISNHQISAIIGPQSSLSVDFVVHLCTRAEIPVVSFSVASSFLSPDFSNFFIRAAPSDASMGPAIAAIACVFSWRRLVPIYEDSDFGASLLPILVDALSASCDARLPYRCPILPDAKKGSILTELYHLKTLQTRVFILHASSPLAVTILSAASEAGMTGKDYAWILTSAVTNQLSYIKLEAISKTMQGDIGIRPFIEQTDPVRDFKKRWRFELLRQYPLAESEIPPYNLSPIIYYAYDALWAVATAANAVISANPTLIERSIADQDEILKIRVSAIGKKLLHSIRQTKFDGISGKFQLINGEKDLSAYEIINVNGSTIQRIGFWTPSKGLSKDLISTEAVYSVKRENILPVIWPGESKAQPKGWEVPTGSEKLRIVVPGLADSEYRTFISVDTDAETGRIVVGGYVIEVFEAAVRLLPYALPFEYVSSKIGDTSPNYTSLARSVFNKEYDGIVGDVTITAKRSEFVDFTFPFTVSGVSMVVPVVDFRSHRAWIFLKPLNIDLWLVSLAFFILTGVVVWFLEHRINRDFRGPPAHQLGTLFYFAFSTLFFAHKEIIMNNLSKLVVTIWMLVVLILTSSYTASLTSMLTVRQFRPTVTDIQDLKNKPVGYLRNSFVKELLIGIGFDESKLLACNSPSEYKDALSNGSVVAIIDEIPYLKLFLNSYCDSYTMTSQLYKTSGFGFAFPKGSSLVTDLSKAILKLAESDEMVKIERRWFGDLSTCINPGSSSISTPNRLDFNSFYGIFIITGAASVVALVFYALSFCYRYRHSLTAIVVEGKNVKRRLGSVAELFDQKDVSSHTFKFSATDSVSRLGLTSAGTSPRSEVSGTRRPFNLSLEMQPPVSPAQSGD